MTQGEYERLVVVVVVIVRVSTHSASSICSRELRRDIVSPLSTQAGSSSWLFGPEKLISFPADENLTLLEYRLGEESVENSDEYGAGLCCKDVPQ